MERKLFLFLTIFVIYFLNHRYSQSSWLALLRVSMVMQVLLTLRYLSNAPPIILDHYDNWVANVAEQ